MNKQEIFALVIRNIHEVLPELEGRVIERDDELVRLGANSVDRAEIVNMTLEALALEVPRVALSKARNLGQLVDILFEGASAP